MTKKQLIKTNYPILMVSKIRADLKKVLSRRKVSILDETLLYLQKRFDYGRKI